jgi:IS30 family transposase
LDWSQEQIAGWLKRTHPGEECHQVSHETIYRSLFAQARGVLKKELLGRLRSKRSMRRSRRAGDAYENDPKSMPENAAHSVGFTRGRPEN